MDMNTLKKQLSEELISSGKYNELSMLLRQRLEASGWTSRIAQMTEQATAGSTWPDFDSLLNQLEDEALQAVDPEVQKEFEEQCTEWMRAQLTEERLRKLM
ncbi:hypothetical protein BCR37DRAFT_390780 [Protomyces lactucae-debilis]|uniref:Transcription and mRNA export factor SUS1 n=1 Tax=Protomyces lactucae-debilis TaxID=2754530 RepID=A0A1Y2FU28_PROLT|nr:uncharacterized protein BCR37DRAFT_390780 [Protomyces lactucae-debilis]ORY87067.1 hypothetical protein BCR37DRAFT_390780 [Protomyces lactucae-debilis]